MSNAEDEINKDAFFNKLNVDMLSSVVLVIFIIILRVIIYSRTFLCCYQDLFSGKRGVGTEVK